MDPTGITFPVDCSWRLAERAQRVVAFCYFLLWGIGMTMFGLASLPKISGCGSLTRDLFYVVRFGAGAKRVDRTRPLCARANATGALDTPDYICCAHRCGVLWFGTPLEKQK